jgi:glycerol-3-phosphate dehydrogenase
MISAPFSAAFFITSIVNLASSVRYSKQDTINKEPLVKQDGLKGGGYYVEYRTDDARLTIEVMKKYLQLQYRLLFYLNHK